MTGNPEYKLNSKLMSNIKYWLLGSFISLSAGMTLLICFCLMFFNVSCPKLINYLVICFGPFIGALIIKLYKKDITWYVYITTGLLYLHIYGYSYRPLSLFFTGVYTCKTMNLITIIREACFVPKDVILDYDYHGEILNYWLLYIIFASFLGGFTVDIYKYFKGRNSEQSSHLYE